MLGRLLLTLSFVFFGGGVVGGSAYVGQFLPCYMVGATNIPGGGGGGGNLVPRVSFAALFFENAL